MKTLRKPLGIFLAVCMLFSCLSILSSAAEGSTTVKGKFNYDYANSVLKLVNEQRAANGLSALVMDSALVDGAMKRAAECKVSFSHTRPNGTSCFTAFSWQSVVGENIAYGQRSPEQVMNGWMNSQGHRENILKSSFKKIGVGCFIADNGTIYWAQEFSGGNSSGYSASGSRAVTVNVSLSSGIETTVSYTDSASAVQPTTAATAPAVKPTAPSTQPTAPATKATEPTVKPTEPPSCKALTAPVIKSITVKSKKAAIKWTSVKSRTGYQVQYCCNSKFRSGCKITATTSASLKTPKLNCKKVYVRVRAYKKTGGKTCYSAWSAVKSKTV